MLKTIERLAAGLFTLGLVLALLHGLYQGFTL